MLPSLEILSSPERMRAWLSRALPGTWSARTSSPRQRSADQRMWAWCASSCRPCRNVPASLQVNLISSELDVPGTASLCYPVNVNVIEQEISSFAPLTLLGREEEGLVKNRNKIFKVCLLMLSFTIWSSDTHHNHYNTLP